MLFLSSRSARVLVGSIALPFVLLLACGGKENEPASCTGDCSGTGGSTLGTGGSSTGGDPGIFEPVDCAVGADEGSAMPPASSSAEPVPGVDVDFRINHLGYAREATKRAVVVASGTLGTFEVVRSSDDSVLFAGELEAVPGFTAWGDSGQHYVANFTLLREEGTYRLRVNGEHSEEFQIRTRLHFEETFDDVLGFFNGSRADDGDVWAADQSVPKEGQGGSYDVRGGWYDASGDLSKYLSHLSYANFMNPQQIPLTAWALAWVRDEASSLLASKGLSAQVQSEALWGADYLVRVLDPAGYFYITVFDGWTGDLNARSICAFEGESGVRTSEFQAAFREGGGMSIAALARIASWGVAGSFSSAEYLAAAEQGFAHLLTNGPSYADDGKENIIDDYTALLAASELYAATTQSSYLEAARSRASALGARLHAEGYFIADDGSRPFWHASDAGLPVIALVRYAEVETDATQRAAALEVVSKHLEYLLRVTGEVANPYGYARQHINVSGQVRSSFFIPQTNETGYWYQGESARLASLAAAALLGGRAVEAERGCPSKASVEQTAYAIDQLDWILGKNPYDISFLRGAGRNNPPHYCGEKPQHSSLNGGIANGITSSQADGSGIQWLSGAGGDECWRDWRWVEQWLPHSTWYMVAITAAAL